jgi:ADP-heptose:LPS heptosyltransferase
VTDRIQLDGARILVLVYGHVADTMAAVPGLRSLRKAYPSARIDALVVSASHPVLRECPYVDEVITWGDFQLKGSRLARAEKAAVLAGLSLRLRRRKYDAALVFHRSFGSIRRLARLSGAPVTAGVSDGRDGYTHWSPAPAGPHSSREENRRVLESLGVEEDGGPLELWTSRDDDAAADRLGVTAERRPLVGLHPGSDWSCQQWLPDRFAAVGRQLQDRLGATIVITGSGSETVLQEDVARGLGAKTVRAAGKTTLGELAAVIRRLDLLVCVNSAPAAIAQAVGTPAVVLLGPEDPRLTALVAGPRLGIVQPGERLAPGSWCEFGRWGILSNCESPMCRGISGLDRLDVQEVVGVAMRVMLSSGRLAQREAIAL